MSTYFLAGFRRSKDPDDRYPGLFTQLGCANVVAKLGVIFRRDGLIMVYAVQPYAEDVHDDLYVEAPERFADTWRIPKRLA